MLVLLIVFMITAPLMQQGVKVELPKANAPALGEIPDSVILAIDQSQNILINGTVIEPKSLQARLEAMVDAKPTIEVLIHADRNIPYGFVAEVMAQVKEASISRVGLVTEPAQKK